MMVMLTGLLGAPGISEGDSTAGVQPDAGAAVAKLRNNSLIGCELKK